MIIENNSVELIKEPNILKKIELAGRCCYNSQNLITDDSYKKFIANIVKSGHTSVLEHSNIIIKYNPTTDQDELSFMFEWLLARKALTNAHLLITVEHQNDEGFVLMSGNARAWQDFTNSKIKSDYLFDADDNIKSIYSALKKEYPDLFTEDVGTPWAENSITFLTEDEVAHINIEHTSYTFKIITSRDITHQIVRHRVLSFSQQSQRWCNYTLDKNNGEVAFIEPRIDKDTEDYEEWIAECENINALYSSFIEDGNKPEVARCILPNCTKSIIYVSGHYNDWKSFIELRTGATAQEEIRYIASKIDKEIKKCYLD